MPFSSSRDPLFKWSEADIVADVNIAVGIFFLKGSRKKGCSMLYYFAKEKRTLSSPHRARMSHMGDASIYEVASVRLFHPSHFIHPTHGSVQIDRLGRHKSRPAIQVASIGARHSHLTLRFRTSCAHTFSTPLLTSR